MKILVAAIATASLVASSAYEVNAKGYSKAHKHHGQRYSRHVARDHGYRPSYPDRSGWYPHDSSQLVVGSTAWWDQMLREGRLNQGGGRN
jgi:hypothetical protein